MSAFWSGVPKFPKEGPAPIVVNEGESITLHCNPPKGVAPRQLYWMSIGKPYMKPKHFDQALVVGCNTGHVLYTLIGPDYKFFNSFFN